MADDQSIVSDRLIDLQLIVDLRPWNGVRIGSVNSQTEKGFVQVKINLTEAERIVKYLSIVLQFEAANIEQPQIP